MIKGKYLHSTANTCAVAMRWDDFSGRVICLATIPKSGIEQQALLGDQILKFTIVTLPPP